jgi:hypothetical protein
LALALLAACGSSSKSSAATTTTVADRHVTVQTPAGQVSLSLDGHLPPNWPTGFPVPSGATPAGSGSLAKGGSGVMVGVYSTAQPPAEVFSFYKSDTALAPTNAKSVGSGDKYVGTLDIGGSYTGSVTVVAAGSGTNIVVTLKGAPATTTTA